MNEQQDLKVELKYVRNFLNVLLYLNEQFKLPLETIFEVYSKEALKNHHIEVVKRIKNGKIPSLCGVSPTIFSDGAEKAITELLQQKITDFKLVEQIIPILEPKSRNLYSDIVNLSEELSVCQIVFEGSALLEMVRTKNSLSFMKDIIENNHCSDLVKLDMTFALKMIEKIKQNRSDNYFNSQGIEIIKMLAQKLIENGYIKDCFKNLSPIASILKRSYIAGLLIKYNEGKYANRLANVKLYTTKDFTSLFTEILKGQKGLKRGDTMPTTVPSQFAIKNWDQFNKLCSTLLAIQSWELNYLIYTDIQLARELVEEGVISKGEFEACCKVLGYFMSINNRIVSTKKIEDPIIKFGSQSIPSNNSSGQLLTVHERLKRKTKKRRSLRESKNSGSNQLLSKSLYQAQSQTDPVLFDIKFEVVPTETIKILRQYYQQPPIEEFFNAIKLVDYQKIGLSIANINIFKSLYLLDLQFNFKSLVPFKYFFSREDAWMEIVEVITGIINLDNFWVIMLLVDLLYEKATEVVQIIIAKIVKYEKNDSWAPVIQKVLQEVNIEPMFLREIAKEAEERGLMDILSVLNKNI